MTAVTVVEIVMAVTVVEVVCDGIRGCRSCYGSDGCRGCDGSDGCRSCDGGDGCRGCDGRDGYRSGPCHRWSELFAECETVLAPTDTLKKLDSTCVNIISSWTNDTVDVCPQSPAERMTQFVSDLNFFWKNDTVCAWPQPPVERKLLWSYYHPPTKLLTPVAVVLFHADVTWFHHRPSPTSRLRLNLKCRHKYQQTTSMAPISSDSSELKKTSGLSIIVVKCSAKVVISWMSGLWG